MLTTAPSEEFETHWGQQVRFFFSFIFFLNKTKSNRCILGRDLETIYSLMAKHHFWKYQFIKLSTLSYDNALPFYYAYIVPSNKIALSTHVGS